MTSFPRQWSFCPAKDIAANVMATRKRHEELVFKKTVKMRGMQDYEDLRDRFFKYKNEYSKTQYDDSVYYSVNISDEKATLVVKTCQNPLKEERC